MCFTQKVFIPTLSCKPLVCLQGVVGNPQIARDGPGARQQTMNNLTVFLLSTSWYLISALFFHIQGCILCNVVLRIPFLCLLVLQFNLLCKFSRQYCSIDFLLVNGFWRWPTNAPKQEANLSLSALANWCLNSL